MKENEKILGGNTKGFSSDELGVGVKENADFWESS
jgi:hypothetical protein